jgi:hypothetical protein
VKYKYQKMEAWLLLILLAVNLSAIFLVRSEKKFLISILFWAILFVSFIVLHHINYVSIQRLERQYANSMVGKNYGDFQLWQNLEHERSRTLQSNRDWSRLLGIQTILTFIFQIVAYRKTRNKNAFWWTRTGFGLLTFIYFILELFAAIVPTGPLI